MLLATSEDAVVACWALLSKRLLNTSLCMFGKLNMRTVELTTAIQVKKG